VSLPERDLYLWGGAIGEPGAMPAYDPAKNRRVGVTIADKTENGNAGRTSVGSGLVYLLERNLLVHMNSHSGSVHASQIDPDTLDVHPLKHFRDE